MRQQRAKSLRLVLFLSFALPLAIMLLAYFIMQFWPIGDRSPLTIDLYHQYVAFISELRRKLLNGESLFYSWNVGLGTNFYALLAYYAASPMNLFLLIFPQTHITEAVTFLIVTKLGLAGMSFAAMLALGFAKDGLYTVRSCKNIKEVGSEDFGTDALIVALSTGYALCAFNLAYSWDIMWLDVIALLPMVVLGINKLIRERKFALYAVSLGAVLFVNYYMAFFVCLFSALYFFVSYAAAKAEEDELRQKKVFLLNGEQIVLDRDFEAAAYDRIRFLPTAVRFGLITLLGVGLSAVLLYPTAISLADTSAAGDAFPKTPSFRFGLFDFMTQQLMNIPPSIRSGLPNVYNGLLTFIFLPLYIVSKKISFKEKIPHLVLLAFLFISFNLNVLDFIWHGMHYPNQLPYRYSFLFSFLMLLIIFRTLTVIREFSSRTLIGTVAAAIIFVILAEKLNGELLQHGHAYINIFFFFIYMILFMMIWRPNYFRTVALLLTVVMVGELAVNTIITVAKIREKEVYTKRSTFVGDFDEAKVLIDKAKALEGDNFYRMELLPAKTTNDGALYGYPGYTLFSSTSREDTAKFMRKMAYHGNNINSYKYVASTVVGDSIFGIKYLLYKSGTPRNSNLIKVGETENMKLYENPYALGPALVCEPTFMHWNANHASPFMNWNSMLKEMAGIGPVFIPVKPDVTSGANFRPSTGDAENGLHFEPEDRNNASVMRVEVPIKKDGYFYYAVKTNKSTEVEITMRRDSSILDQKAVPSDIYQQNGETENYKHNRTIRWLETFDVGYCKAGDVIELCFKHKKENTTDVTVFAAEVDPAALQQAVDTLRSREVTIAEHSSSGLKGSFYAEKDSTLFFSIPYDKSWQIRVDGKRLPVDEVGGKAFLAAAVKAGEHSLELRFKPEGFNAGLAITLASILILIALLIDDKKNGRKREAKRRARTEARYIAGREAALKGEKQPSAIKNFVNALLAEPPAASRLADEAEAKAEAKAEAEEIKSSESGETPESGECSEAPEHLETDETSEKAETAQMSEGSEMPEKGDRSETAETIETDETSENAETAEQQEKPENAEQQEKPEDAENAENAETAAEPEQLPLSEKASEKEAERAQEGRDSSPAEASETAQTRLPEYRKASPIQPQRFEEKFKNEEKGE